MRAIGITAPGGPEVLEVIDRPVRDPGPGEVRITVRAAAVNPTDIGGRQNGYGDVPTPWTPGMDADVVVPRGEGFVAAVREAAPDGVDAIYDTARLHDSVFGALSDGGAMAVIRGWKPTTTERGIVVKQVMVTEALENTAWLEHLRELASDGRLQLRVAREFAPEHVAEAQELMDAGGLRGRAVITF